MVVRQGMALALSGMVAGTVAAFAAARLVASMLFRVDARNPVAFLLAVLFLAAVALLATWIPAFRATRTDPIKPSAGNGYCGAGVSECLRHLTE